MKPSALHDDKEYKIKKNHVMKYEISTTGNTLQKLVAI